MILNPREYFHKVGFGGRRSRPRISFSGGAPRSRVYRALIDAQAVAVWMVPEGMTSYVHEFEPCEGGHFRISLTYDAPTDTGKTSAQTDTYHGYFAPLVPGERVIEVMEFATDKPAMQGEMRVNFCDAANGGTGLLATHSDLPPGLSPEDNALGWRMSLDKLAALLEEERV